MNGRENLDQATPTRVRVSVAIVSALLSILTPSRGVLAESVHDNLKRGEWMLMGYGAPDEVRAVCAEDGTTAKFDDRFVEGSGGCNRFRAGYTLAESTLRFEAFPTTQRFCTPGSKQEYHFFSALREQLDVNFTGDQMALTGKGRVLVFARRDASGNRASIGHPLLPPGDCR